MINKRVKKDQPKAKEQKDVAFDKPTKVSDLDVAFPAHALNIMPKYEDIPTEFKSWHNKWNDIASTWFNKGLDGYFHTKPGIELSDAMRHLKVVMGSYAPKHEHKLAAAAFLMSLRFTEFVKTTKDEAAP